MKPEQENFDALRRILALKRHEQPPPGYFDRFSRQVIARIKAAEAEQRVPLLERLLQEVPWIRGLFWTFETKPAFAVAFGSAVCAVVIAGLVYSESAQPTEASLTPTPAMTGQSSPALDSVTGIGLAAQARNTTLIASTNPVIAQPSGSLFDQIQPQVQPVSFQPHK